MIHTATLLHDDVVDESSLRRGHATANATFGNAASVLVGDFLYSRAFQLMVTTESVAVLKILSDATNVIAEGEVLQLLNSGDPDVDEQQYLAVIRRKTAKLFEAAARLERFWATSGQTSRIALARYGMHLGTAFQLIDDVLDYTGRPCGHGQEPRQRPGGGKSDSALDSRAQHRFVERYCSDPQRARRSTIQSGARDSSFRAPTHGRARLCPSLCRNRKLSGRRMSERHCLLPSYREVLLELSAFAVARSF